MSRHESFTSEGLTQVWTWRETIVRDVSHLPLAEALDAIHEKASQVASKYPQLRRAAIGPAMTAQGEETVPRLPKAAHERR